MPDEKKGIHSDIAGDMTFKAPDSSLGRIKEVLFDIIYTV
jgi:hypothetical protein